MNRIASILSGLSLAVLFFVGSAHAQSGGQNIIASIPFDFTIGSTSLPAGQYQFMRTEDNVFLVRAADGRSLFTLATPIQPNELPGKSVLKFATVDGRHVLDQIWVASEGSGHELR